MITFDTCCKHINQGSQELLAWLLKKILECSVYVLFFIGFHKSKHFYVLSQIICFSKYTFYSKLRSIYSIGHFQNFQWEYFCPNGKLVLSKLSLWIAVEVKWKTALGTQLQNHRNHIDLEEKVALLLLGKQWNLLLKVELEWELRKEHFLSYSRAEFNWKMDTSCNKIVSKTFSLFSQVLWRN